MNEHFQSKGGPKKTALSFFCTLLLAVCIISTSFVVGFVSKAKTTDTAALSFPASTQWVTQLEPKLSMRLFSLLPAAQTQGDQQEPLMLYPGGQPVGILLRTDGILVVGYSPIQNDQTEQYPAEAAGVQAGDIILSVNDKQVIHDDELAMLVHQLGMDGETVTLKIQRQHRTLSKTISPIYCEATESYRIGLLIRDNAGGVGTLTFVNPTTMQYGALGHMIANNETQRKLSILNGKLVAADIQGIKKGTAGNPGEKIGRFVNNDSLGSIEQNTAAGIFGTLSDRHILSETLTQTPLPVADPNDIKPGTAYIYTALDGTQVQSFTVEIEKIMSSTRDGKNMILHVTDPELLQRTGGIIQGMSGSPIIQDGKFIGAVTHVFINDPTRGYGIFIENMLDAAA